MTGFRVLIVEDESITALQIRNKLVSWGFEVVSVVSYGEEAVKAAREMKPDIIIMDIVLKGELDGICAAEQIKEESDIPFIYLTAYADMNTMERAKLTEPHNYILKPFDDNELRFALEMSLYRREAEKKLKKTQNYLKLITENMLDSVGLVDNNGVFKYVSPSVKKILGYDESHLIGKTIFEFLHPEDIEKTMEIFENAIDNKRYEKLRNRFKNIHGEYIWIETVGGPVFNLRGELDGAVYCSRDIEEQVKIEEELKFALNYSRNLIEASLDPMVTISQDGKIMDVNKALENATGLFRADLVGTDFSQYFTDPEKAMKGYQKTLFYGSLKDYALTLRHISGRTTDVSFNATVYRNNNGEVEGVFAAARNITKLRKANRALKLSERHFRALIENALDVIMVLNQHGDINYVSPAVKGVFGYKVHEFLGFNIFDFVHPHDTNKLTEALDVNIKDSGSNFQFEVRCQHENGSWLICQVTAQNLLDDIAVGGIVLNVRDITPTKIAERARNDLEEMYTTLVKASPDGVLATTLEGNITHVSEKAALMLGWDDPKMFTKESIFDIVDPSEHDMVKKNMKLIINKGSIHNIEHTVFKEDGSFFIAEMNVALSKDSKNIPKGFITTLRDINYRKNIEDQVKTSLKEKEILLKEVHHRVKNNMQVISSLIGLQSEQVKDRKTRCMFEDSKNRIRSMAIIHENLYSSEDMDEVNFLEYVDSLVQSLESSYNPISRFIQTKIKVGDVFLDMDRAITCGLILNELISNSFKYAFPESLRSDESFKPMITVNSYYDNKNIVIKVEDNGIGIPESLDFRKTESLGLQIVCTLVSQLGGEIDLDRSKGTKFTIEFRENEEDT